MDNRQVTREDYRYGYQGQYAEKDEETGYNSFQLRQYDARFGRWLSTDPYGQFWSPYVGMGNIPNMGIDPDGGFCDNCLTFLGSGPTISNRILLQGVVVTASSQAGLWAIARGSGGFLIEKAFNTPQGILGGNTSAINYTPQQVRRMEASQLSQPTLSNWEPDFVDTWSESSNVLASMSYSTLDGIFLTAQTAFRLPSNRRHMNGAGVAGDDLIQGFVSTATMMMPGGAIAKPANKSIVIGEGMGRVISAARLNGSKWYQAWGKNFPAKTPDELANALRRNERWLRSKMKQGYEIIDIGLDPNRAKRSIFYQKELEILRLHKYPTKIK